MGKDIHVKKRVANAARSQVTTAILFAVNLSIIGRFSAGLCAVLSLPEVK
jgi:hypothetical protein